MKEIFKTIPGFKDYQISNFGNVKSLKFDRELILKPAINGNGYKCVCIRGAINIPYLVLLTFIGPCPKGKEVSHLNGNRLDDRLKNLKWETRMENQQRRIKHGTDNRGEKNGRAKLTKEDVLKIKKLIEQGFVQYAIANKFNVSQMTISYIKNDIRWSHA